MSAAYEIGIVAAKHLAVPFTFDEDNGTGEMGERHAAQAGRQSLAGSH